MFECLVETCSVRFTTDAERLQHLVQRHHFPPTFRFHGSAAVRPRAHPQPHPHLAQKPKGTAGKAWQGRGGAQQGSKAAEPPSDVDMGMENEGNNRSAGRAQGAGAMEHEQEEVAQLEGALSQLSVSRAFIPRQVSMNRATQQGAGASSQPLTYNTYRQQP